MRAKIVFSKSVFSLSVLHLSQALAQSAVVDPPHETALNELVIVGNPLGKTDTIAPAVSVSGTELLLRRKGSLGETLDGVPGVSSTYFGPVASRPTIRGLDGDRIRILQNGGASMDASALSFDHAVALDPLVIERIEVLRGPGALQYGGSAVGGVVNVVNHRIATVPLFDAVGGASGRAELRAGGAEAEKAGSALVETGNERFTLHVDAFERRTNDVRVPLALACDPSASGVPRLKRSLCNSASNARGGAVGGTLFFDQGYLGASLETHQMRYGSVAEDTVNIDMRQNRTALQGEWRGLVGWTGGVFQSLKAQFSRTDYQHTELDQSVPATRFANVGHDFRLEAKQAPGRLGGQAWSGMVGLQLDGNRFSAMGDETFAPFTRSATTALFTHQELAAAWGKWTAGARLERVQVDSLGHPTLDRFTPAKRSFNPGSVALGAKWDLDGPQGAWVATANTAYTQRAPKDAELYANGPHVATAAYETGNANLSAERSAQIDLGLAWKGAANRFALNAYAHQFANYIALSATGRTRDVNGQAGALPEYTYNQVRARLTGLEAIGTVHLLTLHEEPSQTDPWHAMHGHLDVTFKGELAHANNLSTGEPLPRIAPARLGVGLLWSQGTGSRSAKGLGARLNVDHFTAQNRVPLGDRATSGFTLISASVTYGFVQAGTQWQWFARLENATNQLAYSASSILTQSLPGRVPLPGRSFKMGLQARF